MSEFSRRLATARRAAALTQAELAARLGTTQAAVARLESGRVEPTLRTLRKLADVLGLRFAIAPDRGLQVSVLPALSDLREQRDEILRLAAASGARNLRVFGSVGRGEAGAGSDVDLLVDLEPDRTLMDLGELQLNLEELLGVAVHAAVLPEQPAGSDSERRIVERIEREAVPL
ncbi:MAG: helix-turn-helix domain-containing protein [Candidatus Dormibacteraeota bacterium]|uniref:Helix-turn-helix domain-containing protein n=1 Tax=Candidatus Dormiibacter inghamiae TaxID=3127013 RepID=A0A934KBB5_9BACT|nr:helix-turn-helix domain-containing protein [Candidatus Dormibacteraeota bacterium]MBJ7607758.1 helix-turn-helix domain-containing protein [Candidatus Dormibacteraeota bacterium]